MAWLHTWAGLILGWLLFAMFLTGTASYFRPEMSNWMQPELPAATVSNSVAAENAVRALEKLAGNAQRWFISLPDSRDHALRVVWPEGRGFQSRVLDPATGEPLTARATHGGQFFYRFHFELHMPRPFGRWVAGLAAMVMFVTIISGIITHRRIFKDFFTFRPRKAAQRSWLDGHNMLAVLALPYHLIITYSGIITLMFMYLPFGISTMYADRQAFNTEVFGSAPLPARPSGQAATLAPMGAMIAQVEARWSDAQVEQIGIVFPRDANAVVEVSEFPSDRLRHGRRGLQFEGTTGREMAQLGRNDHAVSQTFQVLYGLHLGRFGGHDLRALLFFCGLMGTAMVGSGLVLWAVKRRERAGTAGAGFGVALVERLNPAVILGLPIGMAGYLLANRLLPLDLNNRADQEALVFFLVWIAAALYALLRRPARSWPDLLLAATIISGAVPVVGWLTVGLHDAGFDAGMVAIALCFLFAWRKVVRRRAAVAKATTLQARTAI